MVYVILHGSLLAQVGVCRCKKEGDQKGVDYFESMRKKHEGHYIYIYIYIYTHTHTHIHHMCIHMHIYIYTHYICIYMYTYIHTIAHVMYIYIYIHTYIHTYTHRGRIAAIEKKVQRQSELDIYMFYHY